MQVSLCCRKKQPFFISLENVNSKCNHDDKLSVIGPWEFQDRGLPE